MVVKNRRKTKLRSTNTAYNIKYVANGLYEKATQKKRYPPNCFVSFLVQFLFQYWVGVPKSSRHTIYDILGSKQCESQNKTTNSCQTQPYKHNPIHSIPPDIYNILTTLTSLHKSPSPIKIRHFSPIKRITIIPAYSAVSYVVVTIRRVSAKYNAITECLRSVTRIGFSMVCVPSPSRIKPFTTSGTPSTNSVE